MRSTSFAKLAGTAAIVAVISFGGGMVVAQVVHPEIDRAERALHNAKDALEHAATDFGGHRVAALKHIDLALGELQEAKKFRH